MASRPLLHAAAGRRDAARRGLAAHRPDTLRRRLLNVGERAREQADRVRLHLASGHAAEPLWAYRGARAPLE